ncbi:MAG: hypothetical protein ABL869_03210 [Candidatus Nitrotoga sp.]
MSVGEVCWVRRGPYFVGALPEKFIDGRGSNESNILSQSFAPLIHNTADLSSLSQFLSSKKQDIAILQAFYQVKLRKKCMPI